MTDYGYARVSTADQTLDLQVRALQAAGLAPGAIFTDQVSGADPWANRRGFAELRARLAPGDTLTVWRLDRLMRGTLALLQLLSDLAADGVRVRSLTEALDTSTSTGKLLVHLLAMLAEFEREQLRERVAAGQAAARARGTHMGRRAAIGPTRVAQVRQAHEAGATISAIARDHGIARGTVRRVLQRQYPYC